MRSLNLLSILAGILVFVLPFGVYLATMSPTVNFWDCGEFISTSYILGIPHPPATPMYVLVGRLASQIPIGEGVAHRINIMSAFFAAMASLMMYLLVLKATRSWKESKGVPDWVRVAGGVCGALFIAFSDTFWTNGVEAEVYSLSAFLMGFIVWLILDWSQNAHKPRGNALVYLIIYLLSLAVGFHLGTILVFPGFFILALMTKHKQFGNLELWLLGLALALFLGSAILHMPDSIMLVGLMLVVGSALYFTFGKSTRSVANVDKGRSSFLLATLGLFALGLSVHLFLYIRAGQGPAINEADPSTWTNLWAVIKREQYPFQLPTERKASLTWQFGHFFNYFWTQFRMPPETRFGALHLGRALTAIPIGLGLLGIWQQFKRQRGHWAMLFTVLLINTIGLVFFLNFSDAEVRERDYFYANGFYFFAIFIGIGAVSIVESLRGDRKGQIFSALGAIMVVLVPFGPMGHHWFKHDRSENMIARDYAYNMLAPLDQNAVIFTNGDNDTFPLWYIQEVEGFRKDVRVVNLSLLNTDWYMQQLRDYEPRLPIEMADAKLAEVATHYYYLEDGRIHQPRDEIINHMFLNTQKQDWGSTPYYFAVTIPRETLKPFQPYLLMEGMAYRMTLTKGDEQVDVQKLRENLEHNFEWRGILSLDKSVDEKPWAEGARGPSILESARSRLDPDAELPDFYKDKTVNHLIQNYAAAWSRLSIEVDRARGGQPADPELAVRAMEMAELIREDLPPVVLYLGYLHMKNGEPEKAMQTYERFLDKDPGNHMLWARYAQACEAAGFREKVVTALGRVLELNPDYEPAYISLVDYIVSYFPSRQNIEALRRRLKDYLTRHPDSEAVKQRYEMLQGALEYGDSTEMGGGR